MTITQPTQLHELTDGNLFLGEEPALIGSTIQFNGTNNILYCQSGVRLDHCSIQFNGNNSVVFLCSSRHPYKLQVSANNDTCLYVGRDNYFNSTVHIVLSEQRHCFLGNDGLFSFGVWIRNADAHLVYDTKSLARKNPTRSIFLGDHVWVGQSAMLLKGTQIHSGAIVGAMSVVSGKRIPSNESWAGNPARRIGTDLFWDGSCVHGWTRAKTEQNRTYSAGERYIFQDEASVSVAFDTIDVALCAAQTARERYEYLLPFSTSAPKNRFSLAGAKHPKPTLLQRLGSKLSKTQP